MISVSSATSNNSSDAEENRDLTSSFSFDSPYQFDRPFIPRFYDNRLRAAAGVVTITPNDSNHPCTKFLAGTSQNRLSTGVHNDLEARGILLTYQGEYIFLVSADLLGLTLPDVYKVMQELEDLGMDPERIIISSTHTHEGPDVVGIWGPGILESGRCPEYIDFLVDEIVQMAIVLRKKLVPVTAYAAETMINEPGADHPNLQSDSRYPYVYNDHLTVAGFIDDSLNTVATLVNWQSHPECMIGYTEYSADFPRWTRLKMEQEFGGTCVYITGTLGGLINPLHHNVPERTENGLPVEVGGEQVYVSANNDVKAWSLGYAVAHWAIDALNSAPPIGDALAIRTTQVDFPIISPFIILAISVGLVETIPADLWIRDNIQNCGLYGCFRQTIHHMRIGSLHMISNPGEALPELSVGRPEFVYDWGTPWGEHIYPAITGYRELIPDNELVMDIGLANNEMGYILPWEDFETIDHPNQYEEQYFFSFRTEELLREAIASLISAKD